MAFYDLLKSQAPSVVLRKAVRAKKQESEPALRSGNFNHCPSLTTCQKLSSEKNVKRYKHADLWDDLVLSSESINLAADFEVVHSYCQKDFWVMWDSENQLRYVDSVKIDGPLILFLDATGSVIGAIPWSDGVSYLYALVLRGKEKQPPIPLSHFLTDRHNTNTISFWLGKWLQRRKELYSKPKHVDIVVCDFSFAIIYSILKEFCHMDIIVYLERAFTCHDSVKPIRTVVALCNAHVMKRISQKVYKCRPGKSQSAKDARALALFAFAFKQNTSDLALAKRVVGLEVQIFNSEHHDDRINDAVRELLSIFDSSKNGSELEIPDPEVDPDDPSEQDISEEDLHMKESESLYSKSPFYHEFKSVFGSEFVSSCQEPETNDYYLPGFMDKYLLIHYLPYFPLWSTMLLKIVDPNLKPLHTWPAENHFDNVKNRILSKMRQRPSIVVSELLEAAEDVLAAAEYDPSFKRQKNPRKRQAEDLDIHTVKEDWGPKRKKSKKGPYSSKVKLHKYVQKLRDRMKTSHQNELSEGVRTPEQNPPTPQPDGQSSFGDQLDAVPVGEDRKNSNSESQPFNVTTQNTDQTDASEPKTNRKRRSLGLKDSLPSSPHPEECGSTSAPWRGTHKYQSRSTDLVLSSNGWEFLEASSVNRLLGETSWLEGDCIDLFIQSRCSLLEDRLKIKALPFTTYFLSSVEDGLVGPLKGYEKVDVMSHDLWIMPFHAHSFNEKNKQGKWIRNHWSLVVVILKSKTIMHIDSRTDGAFHNNDIIRFILSFIDSVWNRRKPLVWSEWTFYRPTDIPDQKNSHDCGVHVCLWTHVLCMSQGLTINHKETKMARHWILKEIVEGKAFAIHRKHLKAARKEPLQQMTDGIGDLLTPSKIPEEYSSFMSFCSDIVSKLFRANDHECAASLLGEQYKCVVELEEDMHFCSGDSCLDWYHLKCVKDSSLPPRRGDYLCPRCREEPA
jgi:hypothetical protein